MIIIFILRHVCFLQLLVAPFLFPNSHRWSMADKVNLVCGEENLADEMDPGDRHLDYCQAKMAVSNFISKSRKSGMFF